MNRSSSFPLLFDRRLAPDIRRIAAVLALMVLAFLATLYYLGLAV